MQAPDFWDNMEKAQNYVKELVDAIVENGKENAAGFFYENSEDTILKFTKDFFEKILLPANSVSKSYISMHPYIEDKKIQKVMKSMELTGEIGKPLFYVKDMESQEFLLTYDTFYFKLALPEDKKFFAIGQVPVKNVNRFSLVKEEDYYTFLCDDVKLTDLKINEKREEDFITLNKYFTDIAAIAMELSFVSILSARLESTHGTFAPTRIPACFTPGTSFELAL